MKRRFSDEQIIGMIKEYEAGVKAQDLCRKYGISDATFYKYKARFGGMNISDAKKLRVLEDENNRLKRMLARPSCRFLPSGTWLQTTRSMNGISTARRWPFPPVMPTSST